MVHLPYEWDEEDDHREPINESDEQDAIDVDNARRVRETK